MTTGVNSAMARAMAAYCLWAGLAPNAQVSVRCGQPIQTRSCGSNSAGMWKPSTLGVDSDSVMVRMKSSSCGGGRTCAHRYV